MTPASNQCPAWHTVFPPAELQSDLEHETHCVNTHSAPPHFPSGWMRHLKKLQTASRLSQLSSLRTYQAAQYLYMQGSQYNMFD